MNESNGMRNTLDPYKYEGMDGEADGEADGQPKPADPRKLAEEAAGAEFRAAVLGAQRLVTVQDQDGGTSREMRVPTEWHLDGCRTEAAFVRLKCPWVAEAFAAAESAAASDRAKAEAFAALEKSPTGDSGTKARIAALPASVRRLLPKWLRRLE